MYLANVVLFNNWKRVKTANMAYYATCMERPDRVQGCSLFITLLVLLYENIERNLQRKLTNANNDDILKTGLLRIIHITYYIVAVGSKKK